MIFGSLYDHIKKRINLTGIRFINIEHSADEILILPFTQYSRLDLNSSNFI